MLPAPRLSNGRVAAIAAASPRSWTPAQRLPHSDRMVAPTQRLPHSDRMVDPTQRLPLVDRVLRRCGFPSSIASSDAAASPCRSLCRQTKKDSPHHRKMRWTVVIVVDGWMESHDLSGWQDARRLSGERELPHIAFWIWREQSRQFLCTIFSSADHVRRSIILVHKLVQGCLCTIFASSVHL